MLQSAATQYDLRLRRPVGGLGKDVVNALELRKFAQGLRLM